MAKIKGKALLSTFEYDLSEDKLDDVGTKNMNVDPLKYCPVKGGYSSDGVCFIAIMSPIQYENKVYKDAINKSEILRTSMNI